MNHDVVYEVASLQGHYFHTCLSRQLQYVLSRAHNLIRRGGAMGNGLAWMCVGSIRWPGGRSAPKL